MKIITFLTLSLLSLSLKADQNIDYIYNLKENIKIKINQSEITDPEEREPIDTSIYSSCKDILENDPSNIGIDGIYEATIAGVKSKLYCNMTDYGGGWTAVFAQFESNPINNWNAGTLNSYNPDFSNGISFVLNGSQIPSHSQISFSHSNYENSRITNIFNYQYTTGNIDRTVINDLLSGKSYHIHRSTVTHHTNHNPELGSSGYNYMFNNTLTIDEIGGSLYSFAFSPANNQSISNRGYAYKGNRTTSLDNGAWLLFVR